MTGLAQAEFPPIYYNNHLNSNLDMSSSLTKRKVIQQKQNLSRLSNSKIINAYSNANIGKSANSDTIQPFLSSNIEEKLRTNSKRTARLKTGRKHQLSVQFILGGKMKEPYSVRSTHPQLKTKQKKKKKDKSSNQSSKFIIPIGEFSKSNSLIVFSEKDSTINGSLFGKDKHLFFAQKYTPTQAAVIIQKTWRGYLTRKLLDQYIIDEESKLNSVIKRMRSKEDSFILEQKEEQINYLSFSSINQGTANINDLRKYSNQDDEQETNAKYFPMYTTSQETSTKQAMKCDSPLHIRSFFKNHKTQPNHISESKIFKSSKKDDIPKKKNLALSSSLYNYSFCNKFEQEKIIQFLQNESLSTKLDRVSACIQSSYKECRKCLKDLLQTSQLQLQQMIKRNSKVKEIYQNSQQFMQDVFCEIKAIIEDMQDVTTNGVSSSSNSSIPRHQPKSQMFTIDMDEQEPEPSTIAQFRQGQIKLQSYLSDLIEEYNQNRNQTSQLQFLCQILKINSERGVKNIIERCFIQFTVEMITQNIPLEELYKHVYKAKLGNSKEEIFIAKWVEEISKWEMGTIHQVTQAMESSSFINPDTSCCNEEK